MRTEQLLILLASQILLANKQKVDDASIKKAVVELSDKSDTELEMLYKQYNILLPSANPILNATGDGTRERLRSVILSPSADGQRGHLVLNGRYTTYYGTLLQMFVDPLLNAELATHPCYVTWKKAETDFQGKKNANLITVDVVSAEIDMNMKVIPMIAKKIDIFATSVMSAIEDRKRSAGSEFGTLQGFNQELIG